MKSFSDLYNKKDGNKIWRNKGGSISWFGVIVTVITLPFIVICGVLLLPFVILSVVITLVSTPGILICTIKLGDGDTYLSRLRSNYYIVFRKAFGALTIYF